MQPPLARHHPPLHERPVPVQQRSEFDLCWVRPADPVVELARHWRSLSASLGPGLDTRFDALIACWTQPHRVYHGAGHLLECLRVLELLRPGIADPEQADAAALTLWYHDIVYEPLVRHNEHRSAEFAQTDLARLGIAPAKRDRLTKLVGEAILATTHQQTPATEIAALTVDCDLAILGAPLPRFAEYEAQIRAEYAHLPAARYAAGRAGLLERFLSRERLYASDTLSRLAEGRARDNLRRSIAALRSAA